jgi:predicted acyl esterase
LGKLSKLDLEDIDYGPSPVLRAWGYLGGAPFAVHTLRVKRPGGPRVVTMHAMGPLYADRDFVVLSPGWRGEAGGEGQPEIYWGEVDDALASIEYLAKLDIVDPTSRAVRTRGTRR